MSSLPSHNPVAINGLQGEPQGLTGQIGNSVAGIINNPGAAFMAVWPINRLLVSAEIPDGQAQDAVFTFLYEEESGPDSYVLPTIELSWGAGGARLTQRFTIQGPGHYTFNVRGSQFRMAVIQALYYRGGSFKYTMIGQVTLGRVTSEQGVTIASIADSSGSSLMVSNSTNLWPSGVPISLTFGDGSSLASVLACIPTYARLIRIKRDLQAPLIVSNYAGTEVRANLAPGVECPWLSISPETGGFGVWANGADTNFTVDVLF